MTGHCFHKETGKDFSYPPVENEVCCHCGTVRRKVFKRAEGHGKYQPKEYLAFDYQYRHGVDPDRCKAA